MVLVTSWADLSSPCDLPSTTDLVATRNGKSGNSAAERTEIAITHLEHSYSSL